MYPLRKAAWQLVTRGAAALAVAGTVLLAGCHNFFICQKASCPSSGTGGGGSTTGDYVYVSNASAGTTYISGYDIGKGSLTAISGSPFPLNFIPVAMNVSPNDGFLYIASQANASNPGIYVYAIGSTGALSIQNSGSVDVSGAISSMDISSDGGYLFTINTLGTLLTEYQINSTTGLLGQVGSFQLPGTLCVAGGTPISQTCTVKASPGGAYVVVALGTAGFAVFPYTSASGISSASFTLVSPPSSTTGDYSLALDDHNYAYVASTSALTSYSITSSGITQESSQTYSSTTTVPRSVVLSSNQDYVYTANEGTGNISGYGINGSGALTQISGSPFTGPTNVSAIGVDKSGSYMVAAGYNGNSGVQLFTIGSTGSLTLVTSAGTGTSTTTNPTILALTH
ncbi:MAG TPA: beta-propeller fold lactonase family protein [Acidobacteriaceae bacterium]|nr:beta-propeller fold lactonase family protein [Acidobacteriaceae bacterium]